jgi:hypothetical protein
MPSPPVTTMAEARTAIRFTIFIVPPVVEAKFLLWRVACDAKLCPVRGVRAWDRGLRLLDEVLALVVLLLVDVGEPV